MPSIQLTALALILDVGNGAEGPPVDGRRRIGTVVALRSRGTLGSLQQPVVVDLGVGIERTELLVRQVAEGVELQSVGITTFFVELMNELNIVFEDVESRQQLVDVSGNAVVAPPPLVQTPQALFAFQIPVIERDALRCTGEDQAHQQNQREGLNPHSSRII